MKCKILGLLLCVVLCIVSAFGVVGCNDKSSDNENETPAPVTRLSDPEIELAGWGNVAMSYYTERVTLKHENEDVTFKCSVTKGEMFAIPRGQEYNSSPEITVKSDSTFVWNGVHRFLVSDGQLFDAGEHAFIRMVIELENKVIGYALLDVEMIDAKSLPLIKKPQVYGKMLAENQWYENDEAQTEKYFSKLESCISENKVQPVMPDSDTHLFDVVLEACMVESTED